MTSLGITAGCRVTDEITEAYTLFGWCADRIHWNLFTNNLVDRGLAIE